VIDIASLLDIAVLAALVAAPLVLVRFLTRGEPVDLSRLFAIPSELPWPRGVQEEEPRAWRVDLLERRPVAGVLTSAPTESASHPRLNPATSPGLDARRCA
jgi:hypothetical protein